MKTMRIVWLIGLVWQVLPLSGWAYYNPESGRWLNRDPVEESGGLNLYAMVDNQVLQFVDNLGLQKGAELLRYKPDPRECRSDCPESEKQTIYVVNRGSPVNQLPADANPREGRNGSLPGWTGGHIDLVIPGCESGLVGFYGYQGRHSRLRAVFGGIPGNVNMGLAVWLGGLTRRPEYLGQVRSYICEIRVCPDDAKQMCETARELAVDPPKFKLLGENCSSVACNILNAGNAGPQSGILGLDNPQGLQRQLNSKNCYYGYTPVESSLDLLSFRYNLQVIVVKDPNQDHPRKP